MIWMTIPGRRGSGIMSVRTGKFSGEAMTMEQQKQPVPIDDGPEIPARPSGPGDPLQDFSREEAAYKREEERLVRDHFGKIALVHKDDVAGVFENGGEALAEAYRRFGYVKFMTKEIRNPNEGPKWMNYIDITAPCIKIERMCQGG